MKFGLVTVELKKGEGLYGIVDDEEIIECVMTSTRGWKLDRATKTQPTQHPLLLVQAIRYVFDPNGAPLWHLRHQA
jgi:hypothetical protein